MTILVREPGTHVPGCVNATDERRPRRLQQNSMRPLSGRTAFRFRGGKVRCSTTRRGREAPAAALSVRDPMLWEPVGRLCPLASHAMRLFDGLFATGDD